MTVLGRFLEFSVQTSDILASLGFYKRLGFTELTIGDVWPHKYTVVSDGKINIGLHDRVFDGPALTFVHQDLAQRARSMTDHGFEFSFLRLDEDVFNELGFSDCEGNTVTMLEARTFTPADEDLPYSQCGECFELTLPARDVMRAGRFWAPLIPKLLQLREEPTPHMRLDTGSTPLGLSESIALTQPSLCFKCSDRSVLDQLIEQDALTHKSFPGFEGAQLELTAPEGSTIYIFDQDFLGEPYVVDESDEVPDELLD